MGEDCLELSTYPPKCKWIQGELEKSAKMVDGLHQYQDILSPHAIVFQDVTLGEN